MKIARPTTAELDQFRSIVPEDPRVAVKPMFGNLGAFVNGNLFMGLYGAQIGLKLAPSDAAELMTVDGAGSFGPPERPMGGYVTLPTALVGTPQGAHWVARALEHVGAMPPKPVKR